MTAEQIRIFATIQKICYTGIKSGSKNAGRDWLKAQHLSYEATGAVLQSGQISQHKTQEFLDDLLKVGLITPSPYPQNAHRQKAYRPFAKNSIMFPLRDANSNVVNFLAVTFKDSKNHFLNDEGIYPCYPTASTKTLYIVAGILDAATILETKTLRSREAVIALQNGNLLPAHINAIQQLQHLTEIIVLQTDMSKDITMNLQGITNVPVRKITIPESLTLHEMYKNGGDVAEHIHTEHIEHIEPTQAEEAPEAPPTGSEHFLEVIHDSKLLFRTPDIQYFVVGSISQDLANLTVMLIAEDAQGRKERSRVDLYDQDDIRSVAENLAVIFNLNPESIHTSLAVLTDLLEKHRDSQIEADKSPFESNRNYLALSPENRKDCVAFLSQPNLIPAIDNLIEKSGVAGEKNARLLMFIIASTYTSPEPLHCIVQAKSGNGKSHLANAIGKLLPQEAVLSLSRISGKSLYHYNQDELIDRVIIVQDFDGMHPEAIYAFRELQSAGSITSSLTHKDKNGNLVSSIKTVRGRFSSLTCTTRDVYEDNLSRSILIGLDEGPEQTQRIVSYQNRKLAGLINIQEEYEAQAFLQNCLRTLKPYTVINKYADKVTLPIEARALRRLNNHFQSLTRQIALLHQYQRKTDEQGRLIAEPDDLKIASAIFTDSLFTKIDDLDDPSLRFFFERLKVFATDQPTFSQREVRLALHVSKTQCFRFFNDLQNMEYLVKVGGRENRGYKYKVAYIDDTEKIRDRIRKDLADQLARLE